MPSQVTKKYMSQAGIAPSDSQAIFRPIVRTKLGEKLRNSGRLTYSRLRECFKEKLKALGFPVEQYGLHSLRAGGATAAANNGVSDRLRYCLDATSHSRGQHSRVCGIIYARDQAKFFESSEFARELTQPSKHFFLFK